MPWARKYSHCIVCGKTDYKHYGLGKCKLCYQTEWVVDNSTHVKTYKHSWYIKDRTNKDYRDRNCRSRNGDFAADLVKIAHCAMCDTTENLQIHHKDHRGQNVSKALRNNSPDNIEILCITCHGRLHGQVEGWARNHACCIGCQRIDRRHQAQGYCTACYYHYVEKLKV